MSEQAPNPAALKPKGGFNGNFHGLPVWGWLVIVVVVGGGVYYMQSKKGVAQKDFVAQPTAQGSGYITAGYIPPTTTAEITRILTNSQWAIAAQKDLVGKGHDAGKAADATAMYINGETISSEQRKLIDIALVDIGPLPEQPSSGNLSKVNPLHTAAPGNLFGQIAAGIGGLLGLNDPNNPVAPYISPFFNNIIDQGPIGGIFQSASSILGGNVNISGKTPGIDIPGVGVIGGNLNVGTSGVNVSGSGAGGSLGVSVNPNSSASYTSYTIQPGDTLSSISMKVYGNTGGANKIYSANLGKITNTKKLNAGTVLQIPAANANS